MELIYVVLSLSLLLHVTLGQLPAPPLVPPYPRPSPCTLDIECEPYTDIQERKVICDKSGMNGGGTGFCLCPEEHRSEIDKNYASMSAIYYVFSSVVVPIHPVAQIRLEVGCNKVRNEGKACSGEEKCSIEGYICRSYDPAAPYKRKCLAARRSVLTLEICDPAGFNSMYSPPTPCYIPGTVDKANKPLNFECRKFIYRRIVLDPVTGSIGKGPHPDRACWPRRRKPNKNNGLTLLDIESDITVLCFDDSDCEDPQAVCRVPFEGILRSYCICDVDSGYFFTYDVELNKEVCRKRAGYTQACTGIGDCVKGNPAGLITNLVCTNDSYGPFKTCQCIGQGLEYFEPTRAYPESCERTVGVGGTCVPDFRRSLDNKRIHDCKKLTPAGRPTGLECPIETATPVCACRRETSWDAANGLCLPQYANLGEGCESGSPRGLRCHPLGNLDCEPNSKTCICDHSSDLDERGFPFCSPHDKVGRYGAYCGLGFICNQELNLICTLKKCICIVDESVEDTGSACAEKRKKRTEKVKSGGLLSGVGSWTAVLLCLTASLRKFQ